MTNSHTEYQPLHGVKARNYLLITLAATLAVVGALCIYEATSTKDQVSTQIVDLKNRDCPGPKPTCKGTKKLTAWWYKSCRKYTCCDKPKKPTCKVADTFHKPITDSNHCRAYACCQKYPKCKNGQKPIVIPKKPCNEYKCGNNTNPKKKGSYYSSKNKVTSSSCNSNQFPKMAYVKRKYMQVCCQKKPNSRICGTRKQLTFVRGSPCNSYHCCEKKPNRSKCGVGFQLKTIYSKPCKKYACCQAPPRCKYGETLISRRAEPCWRYWCKKRTCPKPYYPACGRGYAPKAYRNSYGCTLYTCKKK